jgi:hypothetical protein
VLRYDIQYRTDKTTSPRWPPMAPDGPRWPSMAPDGPGTASDGPPTAPVWPSMAPMDFSKFFKVLKRNQTYSFIKSKKSLKTDHYD